MARQELHSDSMPIEQKAPIIDPSSYDGDVVLVENTGDADYLAELAFNEEPVTIRIEPSSDKNAAGWMSVWVNGRGAEVLMNGQWREFKHLPVAQTLTTKRKYVEVIIRAKIDTIQTKIIDDNSERPDNIITRFTSPVHSFSIIEDANPRGAQWVQELRRRNL